MIGTAEGGRSDAANYDFDLMPGELIIKPAPPRFDASTLNQVIAKDTTAAGGRDPGAPSASANGPGISPGGEPIRLALAGLGGQGLSAALGGFSAPPASAPALPSQGALTLSSAAGTSPVSLTQVGATTTLALGSATGTPAPTTPPVTSPALPVFKQAAGSATAETAMVVTDQGSSLTATTAPGAQTGLTANAALASASGGRVVGTVEAKVTAPTGGASTMTVTLTEEGVLVVRVPREVAESSDEKAIALLAMAAAKESLGVTPAQLRGVLIQALPAA